jgi:hypothetical protein
MPGLADAANGQRIAVAGFCQVSLGLLGCGIMIRNTAVSGNVSAADFSGDPSLKRFDRTCLLAIQFDALAAGAALAAPLPHQRGIAEQARLDREHVVARHVAGRVVAVEDHERDGVGGHRAQVARAVIAVQFKL